MDIWSIYDITIEIIKTNGLYIKHLIMLSFNSSLKSNINDDTTRHGNVILRRILVKPLFISLVIILFLAAYTPTNCGFIGFPIVFSIYGNEGVIYASIFNLFFTAFLWTYGVILFNGKMKREDIKKVLLNPAIVAVFIGLIIMIINGEAGLKKGIHLKD